ncbi:protein-glutamate O-methyltransferase CheR [bacterium D16-54]|nr:protein-glutamate O-methyltransferase CheR [bacterium D16-54]RKJ13213.1 protein-glutamate O-methyltransferase CheR [bacterium D16-56]
MLTLTDSDFQNLYTYIKKNYGIDLSKKKQLIVSRLSNTLAAQGFSDFTSYVKDITSGRDPEMVTAMLNKLTTNYTYFLREEAHFQYFQDVVLPDLAKKHARDKSLAIWSAGCSSGEEPYTISIYLKEFFGAQASQWDTRILATDISQKILNSAITATYNEESIAPLPASWKQKYFVKKDSKYYTVAPILKQNVIFRPFNLMDPIQFKRKFDLIFCRNVMIYFDQNTKDALVQRFYNATVPGGHLFIGHSEGLTKATCPYQYIQPAIYRKTAK